MRGVAGGGPQGLLDEASLGCRRPELTYYSDDCLATVGVGVKRQLNGRGMGEEVRLDPVPLVRSVLARFPVRARYWLAGAIPRHAHGLEGPGALNLLPPLWLLGLCPEDKLTGSRGGFCAAGWCEGISVGVPGQEEHHPSS